MEVMKQLRQRSIRDLVEQRPIRTQQELAAALRERGFRTTQATISRDIAELQLVKGRNVTGSMSLPPRPPTPTRPGRSASAGSSATSRSRSARRALLVSRHPAGLRPRHRRRPRPGPLAGGGRFDRGGRHRLRRLCRPRALRRVRERLQGLGRVGAGRATRHAGSRLSAGEVRDAGASARPPPGPAPPGLRSARSPRPRHLRAAGRRPSSHRAQSPREGPRGMHRRCRPRTVRGAPRAGCPTPRRPLGVAQAAP